MSAIINSRNYPMCPDCDALLTGGIADYGTADSKDGNKFLYMERRCPSCGHIHEYLMDMELEHRYSIDDVKVIRITKK